MPHDVVISYSRRNREIADRFAELLRARGLDVWYDRMIPTGADWRDEIARAIASSKSLVVLFSHESNDSDELKKELAIADRRGLLIFPVRVEEVEPLGLFEYELARRQWFNAFPDWQSQLPLVTEAIATGLGSRPTGEAPKPGVKTEREPTALHATAARASAPSSPLSSGVRTPWLRLAPYVVNLILALYPPYWAIWLVVQVFLARTASKYHTRGPLALAFASMLPIAALVCASGIAVGFGYSEITAPVSALVILVGLVVITTVCLDHFVRQRPGGVFWAWPSLAAIAVAAGAIGFSDNYASYETYKSYAQDADGLVASDYDRSSSRYQEEAMRYLWLVGLGITLANAAYLADAWRRNKAAQP